MHFASWTRGSEERGRGAGEGCERPTPVKIVAAPTNPASGMMTVVRDVTTRTVCELRGSVRRGLYKSSRF